MNSIAFELTISGDQADAVAQGIRRLLIGLVNEGDTLGCSLLLGPVRRTLSPRWADSSAGELYTPPTSR